MPELRFDALSGRTVIAAPDRAARPHTTTDDTSSTRADGPAPPCPFDAGHEGETPPEVARIGPGAPDTPGWLVRVVPNKYPVVGGDVAGAHEVVVLSPDHDRDLGALDTEQARLAIRMLRDRAAFHVAHGLEHTQAFVNHGRGAGASIAHPHAQMVALAFEPPAVSAAAARRAAAGHDLVAASLSEARTRGLLLCEGAAPCWSAWAAPTPYELLVAHPDAGPQFAAAPDEHVDAVVAGVQHGLTRVAAHLGRVPYNVVFHDVPGGRWYARITVRVFTHAGFELGTDVLVNAVPGEIAVGRLREPS
jgi:UDPglucose--hexose-1-phosphate uridylyltransferase